MITEHWAFAPQDPGQGSLHFSLIHAKFVEHSELIVHSGLQFGGPPIYVGKQVQTGDWLTSLHSLFGPHGEGTQGFL